MATPSVLSMVRKSKQTEKRAKILAWGGFGVGKSVNGLEMPKPILVIDMDLGTEQYDFKEFNVIRTRDVNTVKQLLQELKTNGCKVPIYDDDGNQVGEEKINSIMFDSGTKLYELVGQKWRNYFTKKAGDPNYKLEPSDYGKIKEDYKSNYINMLLDLDVHLYFICQQSANYVEGTFMQRNKIEPYKPNIEASTPHDFDVVIHLEKIGFDDYKATVNKSRIVDPITELNALPEVFDHVDKHKFIPELIALATRSKKLERHSEQPTKEMEMKSANEAVIDELRAEVYALIEQLGWDGNKSKDECTKVTGVASPRLKSFTVDKAQDFIMYLKKQLPNNESSENGVDNVDTEVA